MSLRPSLAARRPADRKRRRIGLRLLLRLAVAGSLALALLLLPAGCSIRVQPPLGLMDPATVYVLDHGHTSSLLLPGEGEAMVRFAYADYAYFALGQQGAWGSLRALFWPTQGALGRREHPGLRDEAEVRQRFAATTEAIHPIAVEHGEAVRLRERLDAIFTENIASVVERPIYDLHVVHHPRSYSYLHNSNVKVACWLRMLSCRTFGFTISADWRIVRD